MITFQYEAKEKGTGRHIKSTVQAQSQSQAAKLLLDQGYIPLSIVEEGRNAGLLAGFKNRVGSKEKVIFSRQLATLVGAGLPLAQALGTVVDQTENQRMKYIVQQILISVEAGNTLADSFAKFPEVFDRVYLALVEAGEASGTLDKALNRLSTQLEKDAEMMSKIKGAMIYPAIVLTVIVGVMIFMLLTIVPQVEKLYKDLKQSLPFLSQVMVTTANFLLQYWWIVLIVMVGGVYFGRNYFKTPAGRATADTLKLNAPLVGPLFRKLYMARFTRTAESLLSTGVPMIDTLEICARSVNNVYVEKSILHATEKVKSGKTLAESIGVEDYILPLVPQMIGIGEKSGKVDEMLGKAATVYENELDAAIRAISTIIEPLLMVILAIFAGGMVGAILLPIYQLVGNIKV